MYLLLEKFSHSIITALFKEAPIALNQLRVSNNVTVGADENITAKNKFKMIFTI